MIDSCSESSHGSRIYSASACLSTGLRSFQTQHRMSCSLKRLRVHETCSPESSFNKSDTFIFASPPSCLPGLSGCLVSAAAVQHMCCLTSIRSSLPACNGHSDIHNHHDKNICDSTIFNLNSAYFKTHERQTVIL